jgi:CDP-glycerol glycerophosphotransferase (TagB/SpsB family)
MVIYRSPPAVAEIYDRYRPDMVVFTRLFGTNLHVIKEAKKRRVSVHCLVESWDNFICKGPLSVVPDSMAVWSQEMVDEAYDLHGFPRASVEVVGVPQFDLYKSKSSFLDRQEFFETNGLDPQKGLVTYAASTEGFIPNEPEIFETVYQSLQRQRFATEVQLMLRLHPITSPALREEYYRRFSNRPNLTIQRPGRTSALHDGWDPSWADMVNLASTIHYSNVIVNIASTMAIDAAVLDRPVIAVAFGRGTQQGRSIYFDDIFGNSHYRKLVETKGLRLVYSAEELSGAVSSYLEDPSIDGAGRSQLRERLCFRLDGQSGRRAASGVLQKLGIAHPCIDGFPPTGRLQELPGGTVAP